MLGHHQRCITRVMHIFESLHSANFHWLNSANVVLLPKEGAEGISNYKTISLVYAIDIIAKVLSISLGPRMDALVSNAQSAFIKRGRIHDNFMYVRTLPTGCTSAGPPPYSSSLTFARPLIRLSESTSLIFYKGKASRPRFEIGSPCFSAHLHRGSS